MTFKEFLKESNDTILNNIMKLVTQFVFEYYEKNTKEDIDVELQSINSDNECVIDCQIYCSMDYGSNPDGSFLNVKFLQQCAKEIERNFHVTCKLDHKFDKLTDTDPPEAEYGASFTLTVPNDIITVHDFNLLEAAKSEQYYIDDILQQIDNFINSPSRNMWVANEAIKIYIRKSKRFVDGKMIDCFDLATIESTKQGTGLFTKVLDQILLKYPDKNIFIESIIDPRFGEFFKKKGFRPLTGDYPENMVLIRESQSDCGIYNPFVGRIREWLLQWFKYQCVKETGHPANIHFFEQWVQNGVSDDSGKELVIGTYVPIFTNMEAFENILSDKVIPQLKDAFRLRSCKFELKPKSGTEYRVHFFIKAEDYDLTAADFNLTEGVNPLIQEWINKLRKYKPVIEKLRSYLQVANFKNVQYTLDVPFPNTINDDYSLVILGGGYAHYERQANVNLTEITKKLVNKIKRETNITVEYEFIKETSSRDEEGSSIISTKINYTITVPDEIAGAYDFNLL